MRVYLLLFMLMLILTPGCAPARDKLPPPRATGGNMDLRNWDFAAHGNVALDGEWEFYWQNLYHREDFLTGRAEKPDLVVVMPSVWNSLKGELPGLGGTGYATYRLQVSVAEKYVNNIFALALRELESSYRIEVDGREVAGAGKVGRDAATATPARATAVGSFIIPAPEFELILHVANFRHRTGGSWDSIYLGSEQGIREMLDQRKRTEALLLGVLLAVTVYYFIIYLYRPRDRATLFFSLFCFNTFLRQGLMGEMILISMLDPLPYRLHLFLEYSTYYLAAPLFLSFLAHFFRGRVNRAVLLVTSIVSVAFVALTALTSPQLFTHLIRSYDLVFTAAALYALGLLIYLCTRQVRYAPMILMGLVVLSLASANDLLYARNMIQSTHIISYGVGFMVLLQAAVLALNFARAFSEKAEAYRKIEQAYEEIAELNRKLSDSNQKLRELDQMKDNFVSSISHELRTPLTAIQGFASLSAKKVEQGLIPHVAQLGQKAEKAVLQVKTNLSLILDNTRRLILIINDILDISRLEAGTSSWQYEKVTLQRVVDNAVGAVRPLLQQKNLEYRQEIDADLPELYADVGRLQQVMENLLHNAAKFTTAGSVTVKAVHEAKKGRIMVRVRDTGPGLDSADREIVFDRLRQAGGALTDKPRGIGLGLPISRQIIEHHGGKIWAESEPGKGTTIVFFLPPATLSPLPNGNR